MSLYPELGRRIRALREAQGLTQGEVGAKLPTPITHAAISDVERGKTCPDLDYLTDLATALGTTLVGLLNGVTDRDPLSWQAEQRQWMGDVLAELRATNDHLAQVRLNSRVWRA